MGSRLDLHNVLKDVLGTANVYFQPPETTKIVYPCILYKRASVATMYADNAPYGQRKSYQVTVIDRDPDSDIPDRLAKLSMCKFDRAYTSANLNHYVFNIYY